MADWLPLAGDNACSFRLNGNDREFGLGIGADISLSNWSRRTAFPNIADASLTPEQIPSLEARSLQPFDRSAGRI